MSYEEAGGEARIRPSGCIVLGESHTQSSKLHDVLKSAKGARVSPLILVPLDKLKASGARQ